LDLSGKPVANLTNFVQTIYKLNKNLLDHRSMLVGTRMSFHEVVDGARVASCLVKVSFLEVVDSAPQASVHEVVDGCLR